MAPVVGAAILAAVGTFVFSRIPPVRAAAPAAEHHSSRLGALSAIGVRTIALLCIGLGLGFGAVEIAVPAFAETQGNRALAGIALAGFSAGSLVGGLAAGLRPTRDERRRIIVGSFVLAALMALPLLATSIWTMALLMFCAGLPIAPVVAALYGQIGRVAAAGSVAEAFSWFGTSVSIGLAAGTVARRRGDRRARLARGGGAAASASSRSREPDVATLDARAAETLRTGRPVTAALLRAFAQDEKAERARREHGFRDGVVQRRQAEDPLDRDRARCRPRRASP